MHVRDTHTCQDLADVLEWVKFSRYGTHTLSVGACSLARTSSHIAPTDKPWFLRVYGACVYGACAYVCVCVYINHSDAHTLSHAQRLLMYHAHSRTRKPIHAHSYTHTHTHTGVLTHSLTHITHTHTPSAFHGRTTTKDFFIRVTRSLPNTQRRARYVCVCVVCVCVCVRECVFARVYVFCWLVVCVCVACMLVCLGLRVACV